MSAFVLPESIGTSLDPPWSDLELHLCGDEFLRVIVSIKGRVIFDGVYAKPILFGSPSALWVKVIKSIHRSHGGINDSFSHRSKHSTWGGILSSIKRVKLKGIDLLSFAFVKLEMALSQVSGKTLDRQCVVKNRVPFQDLCSNLRRHSRGGIEIVQLSDLQARIEHVVLSEQSDSWRWTLNSSGFPLLQLMLTKLPSRVNLDRRGIDVGLILCPICQVDVETINNIFFSCDMALVLWAKLARWWSIDIPIYANFLEWLEWISSLHLPKKVKDILKCVGGTLMWSICSFRNCLIFSNPPPIKAVL
ncbi:RNA-directed DNA polymerase, eukaryota, reverse transcriptase zinc-binding domain protein [Tanacetum coccineum]